MRPTRALTLLELLVAVGIVSILATVAAVSFL
ncbi:MAG: prepilin-type N-terminal cleavage/methylation domain-containing protein, partial [Candidatus Sumerlaeia bacterium]|nr:prepilin-type N-terminal cleavage/methylation domain-containing protein [Candidatus Sumerlaeia bacterium]